MTHDLDEPFDRVATHAEQLVSRGAMVFQKFTCAGCGARLTMDVPDTFYKEGSCDQCGAITNIQEAGCNFLLVWPLDDEGRIIETPSN